MSAGNAMFTKKDVMQAELAHGDEIGHKKGIKEKILTTTAGCIATGVVFCCFILIALLSL